MRLVYRILLFIAAQTVINIKIPPFDIDDAISKYITKLTLHGYSLPITYRMILRTE